MRARLLALAAAAILAVTMAACSSDDGGSADAVSPQTSQDADAETDAASDADTATDAVAEDAVAATDADTDAEGAAGGPACDVLKAFHRDITTLPERLDAGGLTDEDAAAIMAPVEAVKDDLPGMVGTVLPILRHDVEFAPLMSGDELREYFERSTHGTAMDALEGSTRSACGLGADWPGEG